MAETYTLAELKKQFGISDFGDKGSDFNKGLMEKYGTQDVGDGTFQLGDSGKAYMDEKTFEKQRNSDETWKAYADVYGQEAMEAKREGNEDGLSASAFDGLMDRLYEGGGDDANDEKPKLKDIEHSQEVQDAMDRSKEWIRKSSDGTYSKDIFGASNDLAKGITKGEVVSTAASGKSANSFLDHYKLDLSSKAKAADNSKMYKAELGTPQNTDDQEPNMEGF